MSKKDSEFQKVLMSFLFRWKEIFKPLNTGWIDERVGAVREWVANVFFYSKNGTTIMIDAGYHYDRLQQLLLAKGISPLVVSGHTGWTDNLSFAFRHKDRLCISGKKQEVHDPTAPYDGYDEQGDTEERARGNRLPKAWDCERGVGE